MLVKLEFSCPSLLRIQERETWDTSQVEGHLSCQEKFKDIKRVLAAPWKPRTCLLTVTRSNTCNCTGSYLNKGWAASAGARRACTTRTKTKTEPKQDNFNNCQLYIFKDYSNYDASVSTGLRALTLKACYNTVELCS